ncbi:MAG: DUF3343 domain-containing protein [Firmicutes bacterium]|nr:DUF3343 domain-containing protein [Bacillota bacterium]
MAFEQACKAQALPGRLIPMPVAISAQCGLAWQVTVSEKDYLLERAQALELKFERVVELK